MVSNCPFYPWCQIVRGVKLSVFTHGVKLSGVKLSNCQPKAGLGQVRQIFGYLAIWLHGTNMSEWGIPERSIKNVAQRHWPYVRRTLQSKIIARREKKIGNSPCPSPRNTKNRPAEYRLWVLNSENGFLDPPYVPTYTRSEKKGPKFRSWSFAKQATTHSKFCLWRHLVMFPDPHAAESNDVCHVEGFQQLYQC